MIARTNHEYGPNLIPLCETYGVLSLFESLSVSSSIFDEAEAYKGPTRLLLEEALKVVKDDCMPMLDYLRFEPV